MKDIFFSCTSWQPSRGSGLMGLLPQPKNTFQKAKLDVPTATTGSSTAALSTLDAKREANPNMPSERKVARPLVPYTLTKKKTDPPAAKAKPKGQPVSSAGGTKQNDEEDEDDGDGAFFSFETPSVSQILLSAGKSSGENAAAEPLPTAPAAAYAPSTEYAPSAEYAPAASGSSGASYQAYAPEVSAETAPVTGKWICWTTGTNLLVSEAYFSYLLLVLLCVIICCIWGTGPGLQKHP